MGPTGVLRVVRQLQEDEWQMDSLPVVLACSDQAPLVVVSESTQRLLRLILS